MQSSLSMELIASAYSKLSHMRSLQTVEDMQ